MACRLPGGAKSPEDLWTVLAEGRDGRIEVPKERWKSKSFYHKNMDAKEATNFSHGYFSDRDISGFNARFFSVPRTETPGIDPQQRQLLEVTYEAIEHARIPIESLRGPETSVHMAMFARDYDRMGYRGGSKSAGSFYKQAAQPVTHRSLSPQSLTRTQPYLRSLGMTPSSISLAFDPGPIFGAFAQPIIGQMSDELHHPLGRRKPVVIAGALPTVIFTLLMAYAQDQSII
ncbi:ketoacyl-synt-domain-containing protein [Colletotrichum eremochloae]|nr:ketoacyl-synt-domain-containing protein [Colletotrichum eremochloae]